MALECCCSYYGWGDHHLCVDVSNVNFTTLKDYFPLPNIDQLVDTTTRFKVMSFMDAYSSYHKIYIHPKDEDKIAFIIEEGTFCYTRMPFRLKNTGETF